MSTSFYFEVATLLIMAAAAGYWLQAMGSKERARAAARTACERDQVQFLDDTVALVKLRLRRNERGRIVFYREFRFEFTSDGAYRYPGTVTLMGARVVQCSLGPYRD
ncbi:MAG: DUF3301 domain-containing protein [Sulfuricaulis sp.]